MAGELSKVEFTAHCAIRLSSTSSSTQVKDGRMTEITGRVFPFTSYEQSEAEGIKESYKGPLCFPGLFLPCDNRELWISGGHFRCSDDLRTQRFQAKSDFEKLAMLFGDLS